MPDFDVIVIGAGPAGEVLAGRTAAAGLSTAIVEERLVGGECGFYACMPSKALLHPGEILDETRRVPGAREAARGQLAVQAVLDHRDSLISDLDDSNQVPWLKDNDISLYRGHGRIAGEKRVAVGDKSSAAKLAVVIAIGSEPTLPDVEGLSHANAWTNREATTSKVVPGRLLIVGGGVVGAEMAQAYTSLGAKVTLLARGTQLLAKEEPWAAEQVTARLREQGAEIVPNAEVAKVKRPGGGGEVTVQLQDGRSFTGDELLIAVGRHIDSDQLGLDTIGLQPGKHGYLPVDEHLQVPGHDWLWVVGDANGRALLTHMAKHQARVTADRICGKSDAALWDRRRRRRRAAGDVHPATGSGRRPHPTDRARRGHRRSDRLRRHVSQRRRQLLGRRRRGHLTAGDRQAPSDRRRRDVHRLRGAGHAPGGDVRRCRRADARAAAARDRPVPDALRGLAEPPGGRRVLARAPAGASSRRLAAYQPEQAS